MGLNFFVKNIKKSLTINLRYYINLHIQRHGGIAQLVEQRNHTPFVRGSSPCTATISNPRDSLGFLFIL